MRFAGILLLAAGCFSKPAAPVTDAGLDASDADALGDAPRCTSTAAGLSYDAGRREIQWPTTGMYLAFGDPAQGAPMPVALAVTDLDLVADPEGCMLEDQIGVAVYPSYHVAAGNGAVGGSLVHEVSGPAYQQFTVTWSVSSWCVNASGSGSSTFGVFPDGRIVRRDSVMPSSASFMAPMCTGCPNNTPASAFVVTTYTALEHDRLGWLATYEAQTETLLTESLRDTNTNLPVSGGCVVDDNQGRLAVISDQATRNDQRVRVQENAMTSHWEVVFVNDLVEATGLTGGQAHQVRTTYLLAPTGTTCMALFQRADAVRSLPALEIPGASIPAGDDQIYHLGDQPLPLQLSTVAPNGIPAGFTISVVLDGVSAIEVPGLGANDVIWQRDPATDTFHVWFRHPVGMGQQVTITSCE